MLPRLHTTVVVACIGLVGCSSSGGSSDGTASGSSSDTAGSSSDGPRFCEPGTAYFEPAPRCPSDETLAPVLPASGCYQECGSGGADCPGGTSCTVVLANPKRPCTCDDGTVCCQECMNTQVQDLCLDLAVSPLASDLGGELSTQAGCGQAEVVLVASNDVGDTALVLTVGAPLLATVQQTGMSVDGTYMISNDDLTCQIELVQGPSIVTNYCNDMPAGALYSSTVAQTGTIDVHVDPASSGAAMHGIVSATLTGVTFGSDSIPDLPSYQFTEIPL